MLAVCLEGGWIWGLVPVAECAGNLAVFGGT